MKAYGSWLRAPLRHTQNIGECWLLEDTTSDSLVSQSTILSPNTTVMGSSSMGGSMFSNPIFDSSYGNVGARMDSTVLANLVPNLGQHADYSSDALEGMVIFNGK